LTNNGLVLAIKCAILSAHFLGFWQWGKVKVSTEDLYIGLYEDFAPSAEYLQADSEHRNFLPEALIISGLSAAVGAFAAAFFEKLAENAADGLAERISKIFKKADEKGDREALLEGLELMVPFLSELPTMPSAQRDVIRDVVAANLEKRGYTPEIAKSTSDDLVAKLSSHGKAHS
jgi:hypothetical protein